MLRIHPFAALRPPVEVAKQVASVPYDVVDREAARKLASGNPLSFLHVVRPDIDLPDDAQPYGEATYAQARRALTRLQDDGALIRDAEPRVYLYRQTTTLAGKLTSQVGVVACCHVDDYLGNVIKRHEKTRQDKEDDRTRHVLHLQANTGPVFLAYRRRPVISQLVEEGMGAAPLYDFEAEDGVRHTVWTVDDAQPYVDGFATVDDAYVADGHHRSASAARAGAELRSANPNHRGDEEYNWYLCVLFASDQLNVLPYNRVVRDLAGMDADAFLERMRHVGHLEPTGEAEPTTAGSFGMYLGGTWYRVTLPPASINRDDPVGSLDYVLLYERVLAPLLEIGDVRKDTRIDFVGGIHGAAGLEARVDSGDWAVAFAMPAVTVEQLMGVADAGEIMPPKSTWFEPKLRSGLLIHTLG